LLIKITQNVFIIRRYSSLLGCEFSQRRPKSAARRCPSGEGEALWKY